jgi:hypothetical protein
MQVKQSTMPYARVSTGSGSTVLRSREQWLRSISSLICCSYFASRCSNNRSRLLISSSTRRKISLIRSSLALRISARARHRCAAPGATTNSRLSQLVIHLVHQRGALTDKQRAQPMHCKRSQLRLALHRYKAHGRPHDALQMASASLASFLFDFT